MLAVWEKSKSFRSPSTTTLAFGSAPSSWLVNDRTRVACWWRWASLGNTGLAASVPSVGSISRHW